MLTSDLPGRDSPQENWTAGVQRCVELKIVRIAQTGLISLIPRVVPAVSGLYSSPPPAGQLCAAATSLLAAGVDAQSGGALLRHQNPCTLPAQLWLRAALDTSSTSAPRYVRRLFLVKGRGFVVVVVVVVFCFSATLLFWHPRPPPPLLRRAEAHCLWRSATVRCPITNRALRSHRHRALLCGAEIARRTPEGRESTEESLQTEEFYRARLSDK